MYVYIHIYRYIDIDIKKNIDIKKETPAVVAQQITPVCCFGHILCCYSLPWSLCFKDIL